MKLIVGLGNPGEEYTNTRHNMGFMLVDALCAALNLEWRQEKKFNGLIASNSDWLLLKPQTFMNNSGASVSKCLNFYKLTLDQLTIVHDDVDLEFGQVKHQFGSGAAGHHGVLDIVAKVGSQDFWRVRIGAGRPEDSRFDVHDWVLSKLSADELLSIKKINLLDYLQKQ